MERDELEELHYITPISNVLSMVEHGILSHVRAESVEHESVAMQEVLDLRAQKSVPGGRRLLEYANLYICARNPMLYKRLGQRDELCVLSISTDILDHPDVVVTDRNAASDYVRFAPAPEGISIVSRERTFADNWNVSDYFEYLRRKSEKCAEVLVPNRVNPRYLAGAYVSSQAAKDNLDAMNTGLTVTVNSHMFFL